MLMTKANLRNNEWGLVNRLSLCDWTLFAIKMSYVKNMHKVHD